MSKLSDTIGGFATIPNTVIKMIPTIGSDAFTLWSYLRYRTNGESGLAFPSYQTIKDDTGLHFRKIAAALRTLEQNELMTRHKRFGNSNEYTLICPVLPTVEGKSLQRVQTNKTDSNKTHTHAPVEIDAERASMPTPRETAWNELATVFPMTNGVSWQKFDEAWRKFPDLRRHAYAIERARKANPAKFTFYLEDFYGYDPDKPKTWGAEKATQPRAPAKAPARGVSWDQMRNYE